MAIKSGVNWKLKPNQHSFSLQFVPLLPPEKGKLLITATACAAKKCKSCVLCVLVCVCVLVGVQEKTC